MSRIVIYINSMTASGGIERVVSNLMFMWSEKHDLILLTKDAGDSFYPLPDKIKKSSTENQLILDMTNRAQRIAATTSNLVTSRRVLAKQLDEIKPDYIYVTSPFNALEVWLTGRSNRKKLIVSEHGSFFGYNCVYTAIKRLIYPSVYCISVPNKTDTVIYRAWGCRAMYMLQPVTFFESTGNALNSKVLLNIGRLTPDKRQSLLVDMWAKVTDKNGWCLWIVGEGELKQELHDKIKKMGLDDCVRLLGATKDIASVYSQASAFAFSSIHEGFGMVLLEAMSFGIPCVSFDCPSGPRDVIIEGVNGFLIDDDDEDAFIETLNQIVHMTQEDLRVLGSGAKAFVDAWDNKEISHLWDLVFCNEEIGEA